MHRPAAVISAARSIALSLGLVCTAHAQTAAALAKTVDDHYNRLKSLEARYTERYQGMGLDRSETGTLTLKKPGRMRWAYDTPAGKVFVMSGHEAISYTPGDAEATRIPAKQMDDLRSPLQFLLGHTQLAKEFDGLTIAPNNQEGLMDLSGIPKGMQQKIQKLTLTVDASGTIHTMRIEEIGGEITRFDFTQQRENIPVSDSEFTFMPPPGVTIVNGASPI